MTLRRLPCRLGRAFVSRSLVIAVTGLALSPASARILRTNIAPSETWNPWLPLTVGSGVEFETNREQSQIEFPILLEYNFTQTLKLTVEPNIVYISPKAKHVRGVGGVGELETSVEYEFISERRYRPGVTALGSIKWPTATDPDIGNPGRDYSLGLIVSKDLVFVDVDLSVLYIFAGDPQSRDAVELSAAANWHLNHFLDIEGEVLHTFGAAPLEGRPGSISGIGVSGRGIDLTEGTLGVAWYVSKRLKIEQGGILRSDGTWQIVFAWEWSFSGD